MQGEAGDGSGRHWQWQAVAGIGSGGQYAHVVGVYAAYE